MNFIPFQPRFSKSSFERFVDEALQSGNNQHVAKNAVTHQPLYNIQEMEENYLVELLVPGWKRENITIEIKDNHLLVSGKMPPLKEMDDTTFLRKDFSIQSFERAFKLTDNINRENIMARYEDGILVVELPKLEVSKQSLKISIN